MFGCISYKQDWFFSGFRMASNRQWEKDVHSQTNLDVHHSTENYLQRQGLQS
jgi:hypothetical protein